MIEVLYRDSEGHLAGVQYGSWYAACKGIANDFIIDKVEHLIVQKSALEEVVLRLPNLPYLKGETKWRSDTARFILDNMLILFRRKYAQL